MFSARVNHTNSVYNKKGKPVMEEFDDEFEEFDDDGFVQTNDVSDEAVALMAELGI